jgi:threonine aldolase
MAIDLRSDTVTRPTPAMRAAMANAEVGDDERDGDPTTRRLEERVASLLGKEAALFFPSGTMANQAAVWIHAERATEVLADVDAHIVHSEIAGIAALSGAFRPRSRYYPAPSLVCVENTHNGAGGRIATLEELQAIRMAAAEQGLPVHMDGARLWNASIATGISLAEISEHADTVMVAFSKGLGAPIGAAVAGTRAHIERAWTARKLFGGAMRQSGIVAAAALYGIEHNIGRLEEDHENARAIARIIGDAGGARVVEPQTNIVMIDLPSGVSSAEVAASAREDDVWLSEWTPTRIRMVTHLDVSAADCRRAAETVRRILA